MAYDLNRKRKLKNEILWQIGQVSELTLNIQSVVLNSPMPISNNLKPRKKQKSKNIKKVSGSQMKSDQ